MPVVTLHPKTLATLEAVGGRLSEYRDTVVRGLVLRVTPRGVRSFGVVYWRAGRNRRMTLGRVEKLNLAGARALTRQVLFEVAAGRDPATNREERYDPPSPALPPVDIDQTTAEVLQPKGRMELNGETVLALRRPVVYLWYRGSRILYVGKGDGGIARPLAADHEKLVAIEPNDRLVLWRCNSPEGAARTERLLIRKLRPELNRR